MAAWPLTARGIIDSSGTLGSGVEVSSDRARQPAGMVGRQLELSIRCGRGAYNSGYGARLACAPASLTRVTAAAKFGASVFFIQRVVVAASTRYSAVSGLIYPCGDSAPIEH